MEIKVTPTGTSVSMHVKQDTRMRVVGFPPTKGVYDQFIAVTLESGEYPNGREITTYFEVQDATRLMEKLYDAIAQSGCG